jgi:hypothetical protein
MKHRHVGALVVAAVSLVSVSALWADDKNGQPAVVANVKVVSDKVLDVSSLEAWKKSYIKPGMSDKEKALACWMAMVGHQFQDSGPKEFVNNEMLVQDAIKMMNDYGYSYCGIMANEITSLARYVGLEARIWTINAHVVPEIKWDNEWHMLDGSLINYFTKEDGKIASVEEICKAVQDWLKDHPELKGDNAKLMAFQQTGDWTGWKNGPKLLADCTFYDATGWWAARTHGWYSTMQEYAGGGNPKTPFMYEAGYSMGYRVNIQLRPGEEFVRNWSNKGLWINKDDPQTGGEPASMKAKPGEGGLAYSPKYGDKAPGRIGNGLHEYHVPLADPSLPKSARTFDNLSVASGGTPTLGLKDEGKQGVLDILMPSSYPSLTGTLTLDAAIGEGGEIKVLLSDNNGLDYKPVATVDKAGEQKIDFSKQALRRYDYQLRFVLSGKGTGLKGLKIVNDIQHSQRPLPALEQGDNTITFSAGPQEGTVTMEGSCGPNDGKGLTIMDFHPEMTNIDFANHCLLDYKNGETGEMIYKLTTPGDVAWMTLMTEYRARGKNSGWHVSISSDEGKTWKDVAACEGPTAATGLFKEVKDIPASVKSVWVKYAGYGASNGVMLFNQRMDLHYKLPNPGFRPVRVTYVWEENGLEKKDVHVAKTVSETYKIKCDTKPLMKSIILELDQ